MPLNKHGIVEFNMLRFYAYHFIMNAIRNPALRPRAGVRGLLPVLPPSFANSWKLSTAVDVMFSNVLPDRYMREVASRFHDHECFLSTSMAKNVSIYDGCSGMGLKNDQT